MTLLTYFQVYEVTKQTNYATICYRDLILTDNATDTVIENQQMLSPTLMESFN